MSSVFNLKAPFSPMGDQQQAIDRLSEFFLSGDLSGRKKGSLLGVTGSGKTFTMANVIANVNKPTLILSHNKTLAAQLYSEFKGFFPDNAVEYFVSYYDYYQPEAYVPSRDLYIEKTSSVNEEIDKLRLSATRSLLSRKDVIIVATVSSIYGLGSPESYKDLTVFIEVGMEIERDVFLAQLVSIQYSRSGFDFGRGLFRVKGDTIDLWPAYDDYAIRIEFFGDEIEAIYRINPISAEIIEKYDSSYLYPAKHFVVKDETLDDSISKIREEMEARHKELILDGAIVEAGRLHSRTTYDLEMLEEVGYCSGIENYARYLSGREEGERPYCLLDFFSPDFFCVVDESHVTIPQIGGMYAGDFSRKTNLVDHGFRLPSALDNRPMKFNEWEEMAKMVCFVSATPAIYEEENEEIRAEQLIRPTGLLDPMIEVRETSGQVEDIIKEITERKAKGERALITTVTKRLAEDLAEYLEEAGIKAVYLHSDIGTIERIEIIQGLRAGESDCIVGVNLLREGLDLPEVSLIAIFDADKEGFLRSKTSLIQTMGRAARNVNGLSILYADKMTKAMKYAIKESTRRREKQIAHNEEYDITPKTIVRRDDSNDFAAYMKPKVAEEGEDYSVVDIEDIKREMLRAAEELNFEEAAKLRDQIKMIESSYS